MRAKRSATTKTLLSRLGSAVQHPVHSSGGAGQIFLDVDALVVELGDQVIGSVASSLFEHRHGPLGIRLVEAVDVLINQVERDKLGCAARAAVDEFPDQMTQFVLAEDGKQHIPGSSR